MGPALFLDGTQWKAWNGRLLVSIMDGQRIVVLQLDAARDGDEQCDGRPAVNSQPLTGARTRRKPLRRDRRRRDLARHAELSKRLFLL